MLHEVSPDRTPVSCEFIGSDCSGADFTGSTMRYLDFGKANLANAIMRAKTMEYVETKGANTTGMKR